jgi:hypothetical protein
MGDTAEGMLPIVELQGLKDLCGAPAMQAGCHGRLRGPH